LLLKPAVSERLTKQLREGLSSKPKWVSPTWLYDDTGNALFEQITELPEYYLTRAECEILNRRADNIAQMTAADTLIELGAGSTVKACTLLDAMRGVRPYRRYVPVDISASALEMTERSVYLKCDGVDVQPVLADFEEDLGFIPLSGRRLVALLGSTIGNLLPHERRSLLTGIRSRLAPRDALLLGLDLVKSEDILKPAYDDAAGVTGRFNLNVLNVLNTTFDGEFDPAQFEHVALWNPTDKWVEMRLRSLTDQRLRLNALDFEISFAEGEEMRTEISTKFEKAGVESELHDAGFVPSTWWTDRSGRYAVSLSVAP